MPQQDPKEPSQNQTPKTQSQIIKEDEIDLFELVKVIWSKKTFIAKVTGVFIILGLIIAFTSPKEYKTSSILIPETVSEEGKLGGNLGGLASLAGVNLGGLGGASQGINPALYQSISKSTPFLLELLYEKYYFQEVVDTLSLYDYYYLGHNKSSLFAKALGLPGQIIGWVKSFVTSTELKGSKTEQAELIALSEYEAGVIADLSSRVFVEMDWDLNIVKVEVEMQDPEVAARMALFIQEYITNHVTDYATAKSTQQLASIEKQYQDRKDEFETAQLRLAAFRDKNQNVTTARARSEEERLQSEYNLAFNVYNQLAQQREVIKLKIEKETPVFTVLEPVKIPVEKSKPKRAIILVIFVFLGGLVGVGVSLAKNMDWFTS